jgi:electron transport complex protein RnfD
MNEKLLTVSSSPHIRGPQTTQSIMRDVLLALAPASALSVVFFGLNALVLIIVGVASAILTEFILQKLLKRRSTVSDLSAAVTGLLIALNMPCRASWWLVAVGAVFAIGLVKELFGGIGNNFVNPALAARVLLVASWPTDMTGGAFLPADAIATATPLALVKEGASEALPSLLNLFTGYGVYGAIGEVSALALLAGGCYLIFRKVISWRIPAVYMATVAAFSLIAGRDVAFNLLSGGLFLGAIFMATDYVTSPNTPAGEIAYAAGCGIMTCVIRFYGGYPEGVSYSILMMNLVAPLLDKYIKVKKFGEVKKNA